VVLMLWGSRSRIGSCPAKHILWEMEWFLDRIWSRSGSSEGSGSTQILFLNGSWTGTEPKQPNEALSNSQETNIWSYIWGSSCFCSARAYKQLIGYWVTHPAFKWLWKSVFQSKYRVFFRCCSRID
jgi:hypothetical protein